MFSRRTHSTQLISPNYRVSVPADSAQSRSVEELAVDTTSGSSTPDDSLATGPILKKPPTDQSQQITLWLRRGDQMLLGFLLIALLILLTAFRWKLSGGWRTPIEIASQQPREYFYSIDVNKASWVEWAQLDGIGEKLARRIVTDREDRGAFRSIDDLRRVRGLGPKLVEKLRPFLTCRPDQVQMPADGHRSLKEPR